MKALSIRQPWAWLIAMGYKDIENRSWSTQFRGKFLIHTGQKFDLIGYKWIMSETDLALPEPWEFELGGIVGIAEITDCVMKHDSPWFFGQYGFVLENARQIQFVPLRGKLRFFDVNETPVLISIGKDCL